MLIRNILEILHRWQNLTSAMIALGAAAWAWQYTQKQIEIAADQLDTANKQAKSAQEQLLVSIKQAEHSQRQLELMEIDQRPFIWPELRPEVFFSNVPGLGPRIAWNIDIKNIGKSSALNSEIILLLKVGNGPFHRALKGRAFNEVMPPGTATWVTAYSNEGLKKDDFEKWNQELIGIQVFISSRFEDHRGRSYTNERCFGYGKGQYNTIPVNICKQTISETDLQ